MAKTIITQPKVAPGDTVSSILRRHGFNDKQLQAALSHIHLPKDFVLSPGQYYRLITDPSSRRAELRFYNPFNLKAFSFWRQSADAGADIIPVNYKVKHITKEGRVSGSIVENLSQALGNDLVAYRFLDAFWLDYNLPKLLKKNARFLLTVEKLYDQNEFVRFGEITRAEIEVNGQVIRREFVPLKKGGVFVGMEQNHRSRPFFAPVDYIRISSLFQPRRFHPIRKFRRAHEGIDFELPTGENVYSVAPGYISRFGRNRAAGNFVVIRHSNGYETYYNHLSEIESLRNNMRVNSGTLIGKIGCTGYCTKAHLHFATKKNGRFVNPIQLIRSYSYAQRNEIERFYAYNDQ